MGLIFLDSCLLIYLVEDSENRGAAVTRAMAGATDSRFCLSPLVKLECLVGPARRSDPVLRQAYLEVFEQLVELDMPASVYVDAAELLARFSLKTPDALHLACAQHHRCAALWTNDERLGQASHGLALNAMAIGSARV